MKHTARFLGSLVVTAVMAGALAGCQVDPFAKAPGKLSATKPTDRPVGKPWAIDVPEQLEFTEGRKEEYTIQAYVPSPGVPKIAMADLPVGASFNSTTGILTWMPDYSAGNDSKDPSLDLRTYRARVLLSSTLEPQSVVEKMVLLVVHNVSRPLDLEWQQSMLQIREGTEFSTRVKIKSQDFPVGPFGFYVSGLPTGLQIVPDANDASIFNLKITPAMNTVTKDDAVVSGGFQGTWNAKVVVVDPSGKKTEVPVDFRVMDTRQNAVVSAPSMVQGVADVRFQITAEDPNLEATPLVTVEGPGIGSLTADAEDDGFISRRAIRWSNIPESALGKMHTIKVKSCVYGSRFTQDRCVTNNVSVKLEPQLLQEPAFDRSQWPVGEMRFLREGETLSIQLPVRNPNSDAYPMSYSIEPASMRTEVQFVGNQLVLKPTSKGFKQFNLVARLAQGLSRSEGFVFEALPKTWSRILVLGDSMKDPEVAGTLKVLPGVQVIDPLMQELNDRALALREAVVLGTSLLADPQAVAAAAPAIAKARVVMFQSPHLEALPVDIAQQLGKLGIQFRGRFNAVLGPNVPQLSTLPIQPASGSGLGSPSASLRLAGTLTAESSNPMILAVSPFSSCSALLSMSYQSSGLPGYTLPVAAKCSANSKTFVVSGVEWADLTTQAAFDQGIVARWMQEVLK